MASHTTSKLRGNPTVRHKPADVVIAPSSVRNGLQHNGATVLGNQAMQALLREREAVALSTPYDRQEREADQLAKTALLTQTTEHQARMTQRQPASEEDARGGQPLPANLRSFFEPRFGYDFGHVRLHRGAAAAAQSVDAAAYTMGAQIVFGDGQYAPNTRRGLGLLAHELAHVVQQGGQRRPMLMRATRNFSLTFDDGPHTAQLGTGQNQTEKVLDALQSAGIRAAFFIQTGVDIRGASSVGRQLVSRMHGDGHRVGIHTGGTTDHESHVDAQRAGRLASDLTSARSYIQDQTAESTDLVRPPFGSSNAAVRQTYQNLGLTNMLWDIDGDAPPGNSTLTGLKNKVQKGIANMQACNWRGTTPWNPRIVVLYHDIRAATANNIGALINEIRTETSRVSNGSDTAVFDVP